jgi:hypothetical protein
MACHEQIKGTLMWIGISHEAALGPDGVEARHPASDQLVRIDLMAGIPYQPVVTKVECQMEGEAELDDPEIAREMSRSNAEHSNEFVTYLLGKLLQLEIGQ